MSCGIVCRIYSSHKVFSSVQQCMRNKFPESRQIVHTSGVNALAKLPKTLALIKISHCGIGSFPLSKEFSRSVLFRKNRGVVCYNRNPYCSKQQNEESDTDSTSDEKLTLYQKFKKMYKEFWYVLIPVHIVTSTFWLGSFYYLAVSGIDIPAILEALGAPNSWIDNLKTSKAGNLVLAYALYKVATPLRYAVTLGGSTVSINYLKKWGWIKPVPNREQIKKMYHQQKGVFKDFKSSCQDKMQVTKDEFLKTKKEMTQHYIEAKEELHKSLSDTRHGFKEGVESARYEWKVIKGSITKALKGIQNPFSGKK